MKFLISILFVLLGLVVLSSCEEVDPQRGFLRSNGQVVNCKGIYTNCGYHLYNCKDGAEYHCEQNLKELGDN